MVHSYSTEEKSTQLIQPELRDILLKDYYVDGGKYLNLGCGKEYYDGWVNLDGDPKIKCDVIFDLDQKNIILPFKDNTFDIIWASHIFEHIWYFGDLKRDLRRILKPGGTLLTIVPYYLYPDAWGDDTHCRAFSESAFAETFWEGFNMGQLGHLPTYNHSRLDENGNPAKEFWLWSAKQKI